MPRPAAAPAAFAPLPPRLRFGSGQPLQGLTLLTVTPEGAIGDALRRMCQRSGARLLRAEGIAAAHSHLQLYRPDLVIVDLDQSDGDAGELIRDLSARRGLLTFGTSDRVEARRKALAAGAAGFLEHPLPEIHIFQEVILSHIRRLTPSLPAAPAASAHPRQETAFRHVAEALRQRPQEAGSDWLSGFLSGLARRAEDPALSAACAALAGPAGDPRALLALLQNCARQPPAIRSPTGISP